MADVLAFWAAALVIAALALPLTFWLFARFPDAGAGLSFGLGMVLVAYGYFLLRVLRVLPPGRAGFLLAIALFALVALALAGRDRRFLPMLRRRLPEVGLAAGVFTVFFFGYIGFRAYMPDIAHTEQPMDLLYVNAVLASAEYPPQDPWLAGERVSYYYGGYLQAGVLTATAGVSSSVGYNLALAAVFASSAAAAASLCAALARWLLRPRALAWSLAAAAGGVLLLLFAGSLIGPFELAAAHGAAPRGVFEAFGVEGLVPCGTGAAAADCVGSVAPPSGSWYPDEFWFWWRGSRVIPGTITEFPAFSFLLGDLHPHVMAIPGVLLTLAISAALWRGRGALSWRSHGRRPVVLVVLALVFGGLAFVNAWDVITFSAALGTAVAARNLRSLRFPAAAAATASYLLPVAALGAVAYAPWYADFSSQASGLYAYVGEGTRPEHAFLQFGLPLLAALPIAGWALRRRLEGALPRIAGLVLWVPLLPLFAWILLAALRGDLDAGVDARGSAGWATLTGYGLAVWVLSSAFVLLALRRHPAALVAGLAALGALLLYGSELLLIRDVFFGGSPRLNTVFKLSYQAWILLSVAGSVALAAALRQAAAQPRPVLIAGGLTVAVFLGAGLVYIVTAVPNRTDGFDNPTAIDGLAYVAREDPGEFALIRWLGEAVPPDAVIVEATGRVWRRGADLQPEIVSSRIDYSDASRVSARTGLQTPIGWSGHEVQWRGSSDATHAEIGRRQDLVDRVYTAPGESEALAALDELGAGYVVVGRVERSRYVGDLMPPFAEFLDLAFEDGETRVYRIPIFEVVDTS